MRGWLSVCSEPNERPVRVGCPRRPTRGPKLHAPLPRWGHAERVLSIGAVVRARPLQRWPIRHGAWLRIFRGTVRWIATACMAVYLYVYRLAAWLGCSGLLFKCRSRQWKLLASAVDKCVRQTATGAAPCGDKYTTFNHGYSRHFNSVSLIAEDC